MPPGLWCQHLERARVSALVLGGAIALRSTLTHPTDFVSRVPVTGGTSVSGFGGSNCSQAKGVGTLACGVSNWSEWGSLCQWLEGVRVSSTQDGTSVCPECQLLGGTGMSEASEGLSTSGCESRECRVCAFASDLLSLPAKEEEGDLAVYAYVLCESCMSVLLKAVPCLWQSV